MFIYEKTHLNGNEMSDTLVLRLYSDIVGHV